MKNLFLISFIFYSTVSYSQSGYDIGVGSGSNPLIFLAIILIFILIIRLFGAWMLRINDVIRELKDIKEELKSLRHESTSSQDSTVSDPKPSNVGKIDKVNSQSNLEELKKSLRSDEMIILIEKTNSLKVIKKSEYETNIELDLTKGYKVIDSNE